jgi:hypothetical protein
MPDRQGMATSVNRRSMLLCRSSRCCHACKPFWAGITEREGVKLLKILVVLDSVFEGETVREAPTVVIY